MANRRKTAGRKPIPEEVPLSRVKLSFSRYVSEVHASGRTITITQHGRPAAVLAPVSGPSILSVRKPLDPRALGALHLRPREGEGADSEAIRRALDEERSE